MSRFDDVYRRSLEQSEEFWAEAAGAIDWVEPWKAGARRLAGTDVSLVQRRPPQHLLQRS